MNLRKPLRGFSDCVDRSGRAVVLAIALPMLGIACNGDTVVNEVVQSTTGGIVGQVMVGGSPRSNVIITVREEPRLTVVATRITDSNGSYAAEGLNPGAHRISIETVADARCVPADRNAVVVAGQEIEVSFSCLSTSTSSSVLFVRGEVTVNGVGEPGIQVTLNSEYGSQIATTATGTGGRFAFGGVSSGEKWVTILLPPGVICLSTTQQTTPRSSRSLHRVNFTCARPSGGSGPVGSVTLSPESLTVGVYESARLNVVVRDTTGTVIVNPLLEFLVTGLPHATVDRTGLVTGLPGQCGDGTVVARSGGVLSNTVALHIGSESGAGCWDY